MYKILEERGGRGSSVVNGEIREKRAREEDERKRRRRKKRKELTIKVKEEGGVQ